MTSFSDQVYKYHAEHHTEKLWILTFCKSFGPTQQGNKTKISDYEVYAQITKPCPGYMSQLILFEIK